MIRFVRLPSLFDNMIIIVDRFYKVCNVNNTHPARLMFKKPVIICSNNYYAFSNCDVWEMVVYVSKFNIFYPNPAS